MRLSQLISIPAIVYLFWQPTWILGALATSLAYIVIVMIGLSGVTLAIGKMLGYINLQWDDQTKKSTLYKMQRLHESMNPQSKSAVPKGDAEQNTASDGNKPAN